MMSFAWGEALGKGMPGFCPNSQPEASMKLHLFATQWQYILTQWQRLGFIARVAPVISNRISKGIVLKGQYKKVKN